jgi:hypothetical protein
MPDRRPYSRPQLRQTQALVGASASVSEPRSIALRGVRVCNLQGFAHAPERTASRGLRGWVFFWQRERRGWLARICWLAVAGDEMRFGEGIPQRVRAATANAE